MIRRRAYQAGFGLACAATPALAGFNEGDGFGPSTLELVALAAFGTVALPVGALLTYAGLDGLFKGVFWCLALCLAVLVVAGVLLAGQLIVVVVFVAGTLLIPAVAFFYLGGVLGRIAHRRKAGVAS